MVFLLAKAALPAGENAMLDAIHCTPFQLSWEDIKEYIPAIPTHTASVVGTIGVVTNVGSTRSFTVHASEYVRDERRGFTVQFVFLKTFPMISYLRSPFRFQYEAESGRWKNLHLPPTGSTVIATGAFKSIGDEDRSEPIFTLLDLGFGTPELVSASPTRTFGHRKIRK